MSTAMIWETDSTSSDKTEQLAETIGQHLRGGEVIELRSDLGGGKTTFTRGLVRGAGSTDRVGSPTFTLSREYVSPKFKIAHFDFYRLGEAGIVADELDELVGDPEYVTVVEWGDIVQDVLPERRLTIQFTQTADESRHITITYPDTLQYLVEGLSA